MAFTAEQLEAHYRDLPDTGGLDSLCAMHLPSIMQGQTVLDLACRRGKGVYKLVDAVGSRGHAIGVDWRENMLQQAREGAAGACRKSGVDPSALTFVRAFPEQLADFVDAASVDVVYVNCALNLFFDPAATLAGIRQVLKPRGLLVCDTVLATGPREAAVLDQARAIGNAVQAAPYRNTLASWVAQAGFDMLTLDTATLGRVSPDDTAEGAGPVAVVEPGDGVAFASVLVQVRGDDGLDRHSQQVARDISEFR